MKTITLIIYLLISTCSFAQNITVDTLYVRLYKQKDTTTYNYVPYVSSSYLHDSIILRINKTIGRKYGLSGLHLALSPQEYLRGYECSDPFYENFWFSVQQHENILIITTLKTYLGMKGPYLESDELIFNTNNGEHLQPMRYSLSAFFTPEGFRKLIKDKWLPGYQSKIPEAVECVNTSGYLAEDEHEDDFNYQSPYDIVYSGNENELVLETMYSYDRPTGIRHCFIYHALKMNMSQLRPYLNAFGRQVLIRDGYLGMSQAEKQHYQFSHSIDLIGNRTYYVGIIQNYYKNWENGEVWIDFFADLELHPDSVELNGTKFYTDQRQTLELNFEVTDSLFVISENIKGKRLGRMEFTVNQFKNFEPNQDLKGEYIDKDGRRFRLGLYATFYDRDFNIGYAELEHNVY